MNFIDNDGPVNLTHLDISNFFENPNGKINHLIGDENVYYDYMLCFYLVLWKYVYFVIAFEHIVYYSSFIVYFTFYYFLFKFFSLFILEDTWISLIPWYIIRHPM